MQDNKNTHNTEISEPKYFTSVQVLFGTIIGGFFTGIYMIAKNYENFGESSHRRKTFLYGFIGFVSIWTLLLMVEMSEYTTVLPALFGTSLAVFNRHLYGTHGLPLHMFFFKELLPIEKRQPARHILAAIAGGMAVTLVLAYGLSYLFKMGKIGL